MVSKVNIQESISIPSGLSDAFKRELGERILVEVRDRTARGIDKAGKPFKGYAKSYDKTGTVNLSQTGDTLAELDIISIGSTAITIGYPISHENAGQVHGIVTGEYGNKNPVTARRDFIGLPQSVVKRIVAEIKSEPEFKEVREDRDSIVAGILGRFF